MAEKLKDDIPIRMDREFIGELARDYHESTGIMMKGREVLTFYAMLGLKTAKEHKKMSETITQGMGGFFGGK